MLPNKVISIEDSMIWKLPYILQQLIKYDCSIIDLYKKVSNKFEDVNEFLYAVDALYLLDIVDYQKEYGVLKYVKRN